MCDKSSHSPNATFPKIFLGGSGQLKADAAATVVLMSGEAVDVSPPAIPASNHRADNFTIHFRDKQGGWTLLKEAFDILSAVGGARM
jgi:hypothetical protein